MKVLQSVSENGFTYILTKNEFGSPKYIHSIAYDGQIVSSYGIQAPNDQIAKELAIDYIVATK